MAQSLFLCILRLVRSISLTGARKRWNLVVLYRRLRRDSITRRLLQHEDLCGYSFHRKRAQVQSTFYPNVKPLLDGTNCFNARLVLQRSLHFPLLVGAIQEMWGITGSCEKLQDPAMKTMPKLNEHYFPSYLLTRSRRIGFTITVTVFFT